MRRILPCVLVLVSAILVPGIAAQELTPRAYWPAPRGVKLAVVGVAYGSGEVLFDATIPVDGVNSRVSTALVAYFHTFDLAGRTANLVVQLPHQWQTTTGFLEGTFERGEAVGFGDLGVSLTVNLLGAPTMDAAGFAALRAHPHPVLGASLKVVAPTGEYDPTRFVNAGANRWAVRAELGSIIPMKPKWLLELQAGVWFLGDDDDFFRGAREQDPIYEFQLHVVKRFKPGFWASLDANYFIGGRQTVGGLEIVDTQRNARIGTTVVVPFRGRQAIKIGYANGVYTDLGSDFNQYLLSYQVLLNRPKRKDAGAPG